VLPPGRDFECAAPRATCSPPSHLSDRPSPTFRPYHAYQRRSRQARNECVCQALALGLFLNGGQALALSAADLYKNVEPEREVKSRLAGRAAHHESPFQLST